MLRLMDKEKTCAICKAHQTIENSSVRINKKTHNRYLSSYCADCEKTRVLTAKMKKLHLYELYQVKAKYEKILAVINQVIIGKETNNAK